MKRYIILYLYLAWIFGIHAQTYQSPLNAGTKSASFTYSNTQNTSGLSNSYGRSTNEVVYAFTLSVPMEVIASHCGSTLSDTYMHLLDASKNLIVSNDDYSGEGRCSNSYHSYIKRQLAAGTYYIVSEGYSGSGNITTAITGTTSQLIVDIGTKSAAFTYTDTKNTANTGNNYTGRSPNDVLYKFTLGVPMEIVASHCGSALDTYMHLLDASKNLIVSNDDYSGEGRCSNSLHSRIKRQLAAGTYYIVSEGYSGSGNITTAITGTTSQLIVDIGTKSANFTYTDTKNTANTGNNYTGRSPNDVLYKFTLSVPMEVVASHCGSALDTYMHLLDASKNLIVSNDDYSGEGRCSNSLHSRIKRQLAAGTYYIVSEGYSGSGNITTAITGTAIVYVTGASLNTANLSLNVDANSQLAATVAPANATNQTVSWTSSNSAVATVSNTGLITAKSRGTATITVTTADGNRTATCTVTVTGKLAPVAAVPSASQNYIKTRTYTSADGTYYMDAVRYYDGLGRPSQTVQAGITPSQSDLVSLQTYDGFGREDRTWLPAIASSNRGAFVTDFATRSGNTYNNTAYNHAADANPYSYPVYEPSPLNRVVQQYGPGANWHNNGKSVKTGYLTNSSAYPCAYYYVSGNNLFRNGNYNGSQLYVMQITDEEGNISYEFKDKLDRVVLQRQMDGSNKHDTYYVYDDFGNLRYVLPPMAADGTGDGSYDEGSTIIKNYAYVYKYDERNLRIWKQLPGCSPVCYVYDRADRLIFSQDGEQRARNEWIFNKYDTFGRIILSGIYTDSRTQSQLAEAFKNTLVVESPAGANYGYSWNVEPVVSPDKVLTVNHYDNYQHLLDQSPDFNNNLNYETKPGFGTRYVNAACPACSGRGLLVGTRVKLTDGSGEIVTAMYYDEKGRLVQKKSTNHLGGFDKEFYAYSFTGQVEKREHVHSGPGTNITENYRYEYDHAERLTDTYYQVSGQPEYLLSHNTYDEPGRLKTTTPCNLNNFKSTYGYDIRSLIRSIGGSNYTEGLTYKYNGNVETMQWAQAGTTRQYTFGYDGLSRLKSASITGNLFPTSYLYDKNGNFSQIIRFGLIKEGGNVSKTIDYLTFQYKGNRIRSIGDEAAPVLQNTVYDFKKYAGTLPVVSDAYVAGNKLVSDSMRTVDGIVNGIVDNTRIVTNTPVVKSVLMDEYSYNANGSMTRDLNKGISEIAYNVLNLPLKIDIKSPVSEARNEYTYSADGRKLKTVHKWASSYSTTPVIGSAINASNLNNTKTTDYAGNFIYENGSLKRILTENGYYEGGIHYFYVKNHLGSNVMTVNRNGGIVQHNHYYPFGLQMGISNNQGLQPYKYTGKELDMEHGLMLYDYGARQYDPAMGRFLTVDPMAERYYSVSPYVYCNNNPIRYIDPTGEDWYEFQNEAGSKAVLWQEDNAKTITINEQVYNNIGTTYLAQHDWGAISYNQNNVNGVYPYTSVSDLHISDKGLSFLINREGLKLKPYNDSKGFATVGVGHLIERRAVTEQDKKNWAWFDTKQEAMSLLQTDLSGTYEAAIKKLVEVPLMQFQYDAIVSFTFNVGVGGLEKSNFMKELNNGNYNGSLMLNYKRPPEIVPRRKREVNLFNNARY